MDAVSEALAAIPRSRDALNALDDTLLDVLSKVEDALDRLKPGVPSETQYEGLTGMQMLAFRRTNGRWRIMHGVELDDTHDAPLSSANRQIRAEAFTPDADGMTPLERLIVAVAASVASAADSRSTQMEAATRIMGALEKAALLK